MYVKLESRFTRTTKVAPSRAIVGWHFLRVPRGGAPVLAHGDGRPVIEGEVLQVDGPLGICRHALHASRRALDAWHCGPIPLPDTDDFWICRVELFGTVIHHPDKMGASHRRVVWMKKLPATFHTQASGILHTVLADDGHLYRRRKVGPTWVFEWIDLDTGSRIPPGYFPVDKNVDLTREWQEAALIELLCSD